MVLVSWLSALRKVLRRPASNRTPWKPELALAGSSIERFRPPVKLAPEIESFEERTLLSVTTFTVNTTTDTPDINPGDGLAVDMFGFTSLRAAIQEANAASSGAFEILVPTGTYQLTRTGANEDAAGTGDLDILPGPDLITIRSKGIGEESEPVINGLAQDRVFDVHANAHLILEDLIIRNGLVTGAHGGGIRNAGVVNVIRGRISDNTAASPNATPVFGGAVYNTGFINVAAVQFVANDVAGHGGAIYNAGSAAVDQGVFFDNFAGNSGPADGGAVYNAAAGSITVTRSELTQNTGQKGGAVFNAGNAFVSNSTIGMNQADDGGGIFNDGPQAVLNLTHVTIAANDASNEGGGLFHSGTAGVTNVRASIIALNTGTTPALNDIAGRPTTLGNNVIGIGGAPSGFVDGVNSDRAGSTGAPLDPLLTPLDLHGGFTQTFALLAGSPAIDNASGFPSQIGTFESDQRGAPRLINGFRDSGAYESGFTGVFVNTTEDTNDADPGDGIAADSLGLVSLRAAIQEANTSFGQIPEIVLSPGVYRLTILGDDDNAEFGDLDLFGAHSLLGTSSQSVVIDAGGNDRVIDVSGSFVSSSLITGVTLQNGATDSYGGGLRSFGALTLIDVRIQDSSAELDGGGIANYGNLSLFQSQLLRNTALVRGGAIASDGAQLTVENSFLNGNSVTGDPNSFFAVGGGAVAVAGDATIRNSTLQGNSTTGSGGAASVGSGGSLSFFDTILTGNSASLDGGAVASEGHLTVIRSLVQNNSADLSGGGLAVVSGSLEAVGSGFTSNTAGQDGGGILVRDADQVTIAFSFVENNLAQHGGGLNINSDSGTIRNSTVADNTATGNGGGVQLSSGILEISNSTVSTNSSDGRGGGIINEAGHLTLLNVTIAENTAGADGGGVFNTTQGRTFAGNTLIAQNRLDSLSASDVAGGRVVTSLGSNLIGAGGAGFVHGVNADQVGTPGDLIDPLLRPLTSNGGSTRTHALQAASPAIDSGSNALAVGAVEQRGSQRLAGSGVPVVDIGATEFSQVTTFYVNTVEDTSDFNSGDGVAEDSFGFTSLRAAIQEANSLNEPVIIVLPAGLYRLNQFGPGDNESLSGDLDVTGNHPLAIYGAGRNATVIDGVMSDRIFDVIEAQLRLEGMTLANGAVFAEDGGLIRAARDESPLASGDGVSRVELINVDLVGGRAVDGNGGAISIAGGDSPSSLLMSGGAVRGSRAENFGTFGGGIHSVDTDVVLTEVVISENTAESSGGGLYFDGGTLSVQRSLFEKNSATFGGGIAILEISAPGTAAIENTRVLENLASFGAGLYNSAVLTLSDSEVAINQAQSDGGGIYNEGNLEITGTRIHANSGFQQGGGVYNLSQLLLQDSEVSGNSASTAGGGLFSAGTASLIRTTVSGNGASTGGGIFKQGLMSLTDSTVSGNFASSMGGGVFAGIGGTLLIQGSTVTANFASISGGGVALDPGESGSVTLANTLVALNLTSSGVDPDISGDLVSSGHNLIGDPGTASGFANGLMGDLVGGTLIGAVADVTSGSPIVVTVTGHGLQTGDRVRVENVTGITLANGSFQVTVLDADRFELDGTGSSDSYTGGGDVYRLIAPRIGMLANNTTVSSMSASPSHPGTSGPVVTRTHALLPGSPAIDAGDNSAVQPGQLDQRGFPRLVDGDADSIDTVDIGAFELFHTTVTGRIFSDLDGDGFQNSGEPGLFGRIVYADLNGNGRFDAELEPSTQTMFDLFETPDDETGQFVLEFVPPGDITIAVVESDGERVSTPQTILFSTPASALAQRDIPELVQPFDVASVDLNGDGALDLVTTASSSGRVIVSLTGATPLTTLTRSYTVGTGPENLEAVDLNGDGFRDLVLTVKGADQIAVLMNRGDGTFSDPVLVTVGDEPRDFVLADLTGDGLLDIAVANGASHNVTILEGNGSGGFINPVTVSVGQSPRAIEFMERRGADGWRLVTADKNSNQLSFIRRTGSGYEVSEVLSLGGGTLPSTLLATDLDYDGVTDLLIGQEGTGTVEVLYGRINAPLAQPSTFTSVGFVTDLDAVDLDGDLDLDVLILGGSSNGSVTVVTNLGNGNPGDRFFSEGTIAGIGTNPSRLRVIQDPAGDGRPDLLITSLNSDEILRLTNLTGSGFISAFTGVVADAGSFGVQETGSIYGTVFDDPDQTQFQGVNEQGLAGIEVYLDLNLNGVRDSFEPVAVTQTDNPLTTFLNEAGQYLFLDLPIGRQYQVGVSLPGNRVQVAPDSPQFLTRPTGVVTGQVVDQVPVDLDGDGNLDLLVMTNIGVESFFRIFMGDGTGDLTGGSTLAGGDATDHFTILDVDGDEDSDVAVVRSSGTLDLYRNNSGTLTFDRQLPVAPGMTRIRSADMNGDGRADLILSTDSAGPSDGAFLVLINDPDQSEFISLAAGPTTTGISVADFAVADVNGDGTLDIAAVGPSDENTLYVFLNDGDGNLTLQNSSALAGTGAVSLALADFNGDGALDAAVTTLDSEFLEIQYGIALGAGSFSGSAIQSVSAASGTLLVEDLNGDGRPDIVIDGGAIGTFLLVNEGPLAFATYIVDSSEAISLASGDFDSDGRTDLLAASPGDGILLRLLLNRPDQRTVDVTFSGLFSTPPADFATTLYAQISGTVFADQDGSGQQESGEDGLADVTVFLDLNQNGRLDSFEPQATTNASGEYLLNRVYPQIDENFVTVRIIAPAGLGVTSPRNLHLGLDATIPAGFGAQSVAAGDLNADGEADLVVVNGDGSLLIALRQDGLFSYQTVIPGGGRAPRQVQLADLNNDGALDIVTVNDSSTMDLTVLYGAGDGTFGNQTDVLLPGPGREFVIHDFTKDGFLDAAVVVPFSGQILILHNDGTGQLELQPELSTSGFPHALVAGDFDGDGTADLAVADLGTDEVLFFAGRAGGTFAAPVSSTADNGIHDIAAGDFNEDGNLDVAVISSTTDQLTILTGDGTGQFIASATIPLEHPLFFSGPGNVIATDINGDGHIDLAITDNGSARGVIFGGNGSGVFPLTEVVEAVDGGGTISRPVAADLNGDGLPELIVTNTTLGAVHLLENQAATFRIPAAAGESYSAVAFGVQSSNQAPDIQVPGLVVTPEDTPFVFSSGTGTAIVVSDPDAADSDLELSLSVTNGSLTLGAVDGLLFVQGDGINDTGLTVRGSIASINAALEGLSYVPLQNFDGNSQLVISVSDLGHNGAGGPRTATTAVSLTVTPVNDAPVIQVPGTQAVTEDSPLAFSVPGGNAIRVQDTEAVSAEITLSVTQGTLTLGSVSGLTFSNGDGISDATMTFSGPLSLINVALDGLQFVPVLNFNGPAQLNIMANDLGQSGTGGSQTASQTVSINVSAVNDAPVVNVPGTQTISEDSILTFSSGNSNAITVSDVDATTGQAILTVTNGVLTLNGTTGLTFADGDGTADATMTFTGTLASINAALNGLTFVPNGNFNGNAQLNLDVRDQGNSGTGGVRIGSGAVTIAVTGVNDAPVLNVPGPQTAVEEALLIFSPAGGNAVSVGDVDATALQLTLSVISGRISLGTLAGLTFQTGDGTSDSSMTFTGAPADINAALDGLTFEPVVNFTGNLTLSLAVSDLGQTGSGGTLQDSESISISISAVNDAPVVQAPASAGVLQDADLIFSVAEGRAITVSDVDAGAGSVELSLSVQKGTLTLATIAGLSLTAGDGDADSTMTFTGTVSDINAALDGLLYRPDPGETGADQLSLLLNDLGHTGAGGPLSASHTVELTIGAVNAPPVFPSQTVEFTIDEHIAAGTLIHTVLVSDPDSDPLDLSFAIIDGNTGGAFEIHPVTGALTVASSEALNFESQPAFSLTIQVTDSRAVAPTPLTAAQVFTIHLNDLVESFVIGPDVFAQGSVTLRRDGNLLRAVDAQNEDLVPPARFDRVAEIHATGRSGQNDVLQVLFGSVPLVSGGTTISAPALRVLGDLTSQAGLLDVTGDLTATGLFAPVPGSRFRGAVTAEAGAFLDGITIDGDVLMAGPATISGTVVFNASAVLTGTVTVHGTLSVPNEQLMLTGDVILNQGTIQADAGTQFGGQPPLTGGGTGTGGSGTGSGGIGGGVVGGFSGGIVTPLNPVTLSGEGTIAGGLLRVLPNGVINPSGVSQRITLPVTSMSPGSVLHADLRQQGTSDSVRSSNLLTPDGAFLQPVLLQPAGPDATFIIVQNDGTGVVSSGLFGPAVDSGTGTDLGSSQILVTDLTDGRATLFSDSFGQLDDGTFDPVGPAAEAGAIFESSVFFRSNGSGPRSSLSELGTNPSTIRGTDQEGNSTFRIGNLLFTLTQTLTPIVGTESQIIGSLLTQTYAVTNLGSTTEEFELARYLDADLLFDGTLSDRGGRLVTPSGVELLYEIDSGSSGPSSSTLVAITAIGGTHPQTGRFAIDSFSGLRRDLRDGLDLDDQIAGDADLDGIIDEGAEYDVTLAFLNLFSLNAGESDLYTTHTLLATGLPQDVVQAGDTTFNGLPEGSGLDVPILNEQNEVVGTQRFVISYFGGDGNDIELRVSSGISGRAWQDLNGDGVRDLNDPALAGVAVRLFDQETGDLLSTTTTGQDGLYHFDDLLPGSYFVEFTAPDGQILTLRDAASDDIDSDANRLTGRTSLVSLEGGQSLSGIDAGFIEARVSIQGPEAVDEGPLGAVSPVDFTVTLNGPSMVPVTVFVQAFSGQSGPVNSRATLGVDFQQIPTGQSLVTFQPGQTSQRVRLNVTGDNLPEQDERFEVRLLNPTQAAVDQGTAVVTIINDDVETPRVVLNPVASVIEGQAPDIRPLEFSVRLLGGPVSQDITVNYETILPPGMIPVGVATPGVDYVAASGSVLIRAGQTTASIRLQVIGDRTIEPDETLQIRLTGLQAGTTGAVLGNVTQATGTIINDDVAVPVLTIGNAETIEQNAPRRVALQFPVTLNGPSDQDVTITFSTLQLTGAGTATTGVDYVAVSGKTLVIPRGRTSGVLEIEVIGDSTIEPDEVVAVEITAVANAILQESIGIGTIINDDFARPKVLLRDASILEGRQGQVTPLHFELIMTGALPQDVIVTVSTAALNQAGAATSGGDFEAVISRQVRIPAGMTSVFIPVQIFGDELEENDEQFRLLITQAGAAVDIDPTRQQATGTIRNDDRSRPMVSIDRETFTRELDAPRTSTAAFVVRLDAVSSQEVSVAFRTQEVDAPGAATADVDYRAVNNGLITFAPGETEKVIQIVINGDDLIEPPETFFLELTGITAGAADLDPFQRFSQAVIFDDDEARPAVSLTTDISVLEPDNNGRSAAELTVNLSSAHSEDIAIHYVTRSGPPPGAATPGSDFTDAASGTLVIPAGARSGIIRIEILGDRLIEGDETFVVELVEVTSANADLPPGGRQAVVTIIDNDFARPTVSLSAGSVIEGDPGDESELVFVVTLSGPAPTSTVQVELETFRLADNLPGLARSEGAGRDYFATTRTLTFEPGVTTKEFRVRVVPDDTFEATEQVFARITSATGAAIDLAGASISGFIINDDPPEPVLSINSVRVLEGDAPGEMVLTFEVTLDADPEAGVIPDVTVNYTTIDLSALAGQDYTATSGTLTFTDGIRSQLISVPVLGNTVDDGLRELLVELSSPMGAMLNPGAFQGLGTIRDDDSPGIVFEIDSVQQREGSSGTTTFDFTITRVGKSSTPVSVNYATQPGTATAGVDYTTRSGTVTFMPGSSPTQTVSISVTGDRAIDSEFETFFVTLDNPVGGTLDPATRQGVGTILDDDAIVFDDDADAELMRIAAIIQDAISQLGNDPDNQELIDLITQLSREVLQRVGLSSGFVYVTDPVDFLLTDAAGRTTGYTQAAGEVTQAPRSYYSGDRNVELVVIPQAAGGVYGLQLSGVGSGEYRAAATLVREDGTAKTLTQAGTLSGNVQLALDFSDAPLVRFDRDVVAQLADNLRTNTGVTGANRQIAVSEEARQAMALAQAGLRDAVTDSSRPISAGDAFRQLFSVFSQAGQSLAGEFTRQFNELLRDLGGEDASAPQTPEEAERDEAVDQFWSRLGRTLIGAPGNLLDLSEFFEVLTPEGESPNSTPTETPQNEENSDGKPADQAPPSNAGPKTTSVERPVNRFRAWAESRYARSDADKPSPWQPVSRPKAEKVEPARNSSSAAKQPETKDRADLARQDERPRPDESGHSEAGHSDDAAG